MSVLIACEESQAVTIEMRKIGIEAHSADIQECSGGHPEWHIQCDVLDILYDDWDMVIAFPPCTDLAVSGAAWFADKIADGRQRKSIEFFMLFTELQCPFAIENPVGIMSSLYRKPHQIIQPWQFGHGETKATCLWINGLPLLQSTDIAPGREQRIQMMPQSPERSKLRSKTYPGIARAMAHQWGKFLTNDSNYVLF